MIKEISLDNLNKIDRKKNKIVFISGNFNTFHPGHLRLLKYAQKFGNIIVIGLNDDKSKGVFVPQILRYENLESVSIIDFIYMINDDMYDFIQYLKPDFVLKGKEFEFKKNIEEDIVNTYGGQLLFSSGEVTFSSSLLIENEFKKNDLIFSHDYNYLENHNIKKDDFNSVLKSLSDLNVLVIGDSIVDKYIYCDPIGMSQEEPVITVKPIDEKLYLGGAAIVSMHAKSFVKNVHFFSLVGSDELGEFIRKQLKKANVKSHLYHDENRSSSLKTRFKVNLRSMFRINDVSTIDISTSLQKSIYENIKETIIKEKIDIVIFSDFNYGLLTNYLINEIIKFCKHKNIMLCADCQTSSQIGNLLKYHNVNLITPTEHELRMAMNNKDSGIPIVAKELCDELNIKDIIVTLGENGAFVSDSNNSDIIRCINKNALDTSGAGDSLLVGASLALVAGSDIWLSAYFGSMFAAIQVSQLSNKPITQNALTLLINKI